MSKLRHKYLRWKKLLVQKYCLGFYQLRVDAVSASPIRMQSKRVQFKSRLRGSDCNAESVGPVETQS